MTIKDLTSQQLKRIYWRIYNTYADRYGLDWRTLRIIAPGAACSLDAILREFRTRKVS